MTTDNKPANHRLIQAITFRNRANIEAAMADGADINARNDKGVPGTMIAAMNEDYGTLFLLLDRYQADKNAISTSGFTLLHQLLVSAPAREIKDFLARKPDLDTTAGEHPYVAYAISMVRLDPAKALMDAGAPVDRYMNGKSTFEYAQECGLEEIQSQVVAAMKQQVIKSIRTTRYKTLRP